MALQMNKKILLIESGHYGEDIISLSRAGFQVVVLTTGVLPIDKDNLAAATESHNDRNFIDYSVLRSKVEELLSNCNEFTSIFTTSDFFVAHVARLCEEFSFHYLSSEAATLFANKALFRIKQKELGYLCPDFNFFVNYQDGYEYITENTQKLPLVFKPVSGTESIGVSLIYSANDLKKCCKELILHSKFSRNMISQEYVLEEYIEGEVVSCEFICSESEIRLLGITDRVMSTPPHFIELGYSFPCDHFMKVELYAETRKIIKDFKYNFGPGHIEFIVNKQNEIYILEINSRLVGWPISKMISDSLKQDVFVVLANLYESGKLPLINIKNFSTYTCFEVTTLQSGRLINYFIPEKFINDPAITFYFFKNKGDIVKAAKSNTDLIMRFIVEAQNYKDSTKIANRVLNSIEIQIEPSEERKR